MATPKINLEIVSIQRTVFSDTVDMVKAETPDGQITILPHHIPLISLLERGELEVRKDGEDFFFALSGGFLEIRPNKIIILVEEAEASEEINETAAQQARDRAEKLVRERKNVDDVEFADAKALLQKSLLQLKVAGRRKTIRKQRPPMR